MLGRHHSPRQGPLPYLAQPEAGYSWGGDISLPGDPKTRQTEEAAPSGTGGPQELGGTSHYSAHVPGTLSTRAPVLTD